MNNLTSRLYRYPVRVIGVHVLFWSLFIAYELSFLSYSSVKSSPLAHYLLFYGVNISLFYALSLVIRPISAGSPATYLRTGLSVILVIIAYLLVKFVANTLTGDLNWKATPYELLQFAVSALYRAGYFGLLAVFYWATRHIVAYKQKADEAERQKLLTKAEHAELRADFANVQVAYLQQQINPHLLFNALNFVYSKVMSAEPEAGRCVFLLSELLRFSVNTAAADGKVPVSEELDQIEHLIEINQFRFDGLLYLDIDVEGDFDGYRIIPLILLTLTENVFKHGDLTVAGDPALLSYRLSGNELHFHSHNLKKTKSVHPRNVPSGLANLRTRLQYAYAERYHLAINESEQYFDLDLTLQL